MSDITMCVNKLCPLFDECYRAQAEPNPYWQSYAMFNYDGTLKCDMYITLKRKVDV